ncbi:hypothetical protein LJB88_04550 [Erysipelotrichaceae bacterium OttesenSCG-928-M19]|nr:hypothetical protein [Erysipelotrichaceae bacterium OttesenSCG-928-M19]
MKSSKIKLTIIEVVPDEVEKGVFKKREVKTKINAWKQELFQNRLDIARKEGMVINGRFKVRTIDIVKPEYLEIDNVRYRISTIQTGPVYTHIEAGEQV